MCKRKWSPLRTNGLSPRAQGGPSNGAVTAGPRVEAEHRGRWSAGLEQSLRVWGAGLGGGGTAVLVKESRDEMTGVFPEG